MPEKKTIKILPDIHRNKNVITFSFDFYHELIGFIKEIEEIGWSKTMKKWYGPKDNYNLTNILSVSVSKLLRDYLSRYKTNYWLFEGIGRRKYRETSIVKVLKAVAIRAGIQKRVASHMLRHSFATHLLKQGVDIRYIQTILGHESSKTTDIYTHVSNKSLAKIKSPLDVILSDNNNYIRKLKRD